MRSWIAPPEQAASAKALEARLVEARAPRRRTGTPGHHAPGHRHGAQRPIERLLAWLQHHAVWLLPALITALAAWIRLAHLNQPHDLTFDETYYVKDAFTLLQSGYERQWPEEGANEQFLAGDPRPLEEASYVVHPPLGKWLIGWGMLLFGTDNGLGWRFATALTGTLSVPLMYLVGRRLFGSVALASIAALLTAIDGHHIALSRTALLDIFQMFFLLLAFYLLLVDRSYGRRRLAAAVARVASVRGAARRALDYGPWLAWRPWRLAAGVALGAAVGIKWSSLAFVAVFGLMSVLWDMGARRAAGIRYWGTAGLFRDGIPAFLTVIPAAAVTYLATWAGWLSTSGGYDRQWAAEHPDEAWPLVPDALRSLAEYHRSAYQFHNGLSSDHSWESGPETWLLAGRPVLFHFETVEGGQQLCGFDTCKQAITDLPNPLIWWSAAVALLVVLFFWAGRRDWRAGAILAGVAAGFVPWWFYPERTMFFFYTITFHPFLILGLTFVLGLVLRWGGRPGGRGVLTPLERRRVSLAAVGLFLALALAVSAFFLPIWTGAPMGPDGWGIRMWLPTWG